MGVPELRAAGLSDLAIQQTISGQVLCTWLKSEIAERHKLGQIVDKQGSAPGGGDRQK